MKLKKEILVGLLALVALGWGVFPAQSKTPSRAKATTAEKAFLGVYLNDIDKDTQEALNLDSGKGALVEDVQEHGPAAEAGVEKEDVIISFDGKQVKDSDQLKEYLAKHKPGDNIEVVVIRDGQKKSLKVDLGSSQSLSEELTIPEPGDMKTFSFSVPSFNRARMGVQIMDLTKQLGDYFGIEEGQGALITEVTENSPAQKAGLKAGDVIVKVDKDKITGTSDVYQALEGKKKGDEVNVEVTRDQGRQSLTVTVKLEGSERNREAWQSVTPQLRRGIQRDIKVFTDKTIDQSELQAEIKKLQKEVEQLRKDLEKMKEEPR